MADLVGLFDSLASMIWNPFMCLLYVMTGLLFLFATNGIAWTKGLSVSLAIFRRDRSVSDHRVLSHRRALISSVAATVGIGNLAGVATAIHLGGPGALFWMWISALFGMSYKLCSTYFTVKYRPSDRSSPLFATPMVYLERYMKGSWSFVATLVASMIFIQGVILSNLVQSNSLSQALHNRFDVPNYVVAVVLTACVGFIILGGLKKIAHSSAMIAPWIILMYVAAGLAILLLNPTQTVSALGNVFYYAFKPHAMAGGIAGYAAFQAMQFGISRGIFSHMSGLGSSAFLQGANEDAPAAGAYMSAATPFIDTIIICTITGLVILSFPLWQSHTGAFLTLESFGMGLGFIGEVVVVVSLIVFSFTTITAFSHISEQCFSYLGGKTVLSYRITFLAVTFAGPFLNLNFVWSLSDIIIGVLLAFHLLPLLSVTLQNLRPMLKDLDEFASSSEAME